MSQVRFFTDEDVYGVLAGQLRAKGFDAISTPEAGRLGEADADQLEWASQNNWTLISFNVADFARIHHDYMVQGKHHRGIVVSNQYPIGVVLKRLLHLGQTLSVMQMQDRLEYLSSW